jgi:hypothetical protein
MNILIYGILGESAQGHPVVVDREDMERDYLWRQRCSTHARLDFKHTYHLVLQPQWLLDTFPHHRR